MLLSVILSTSDLSFPRPYLQLCCPCCENLGEWLAFFNSAHGHRRRRSRRRHAASPARTGGSPRPGESHRGMKLPPGSSDYPWRHDPWPSPIPVAPSSAMPSVSSPPGGYAQTRKNLISRTLRAPSCPCTVRDRRRACAAYF